MESGSDSSTAHRGRSDTKPREALGFTGSQDSPSIWDHGCLVQEGPGAAQFGLTDTVLGEDSEGIVCSQSGYLLPTWGSDSDLAAELGVCSSLQLIKGHQAPAFS